jgi:ketosteroid isomerase-like protein
MLGLLNMIGLACMLLSFAAAPALAAPADDASDVIDLWAKAYNDNDPTALMKLYAADAVMFGTAEPMIFDGSEPIGAHFSGLAGSGDKVRICSRRVLPPPREDAALVTGSYQFEVIKDGVRALLPGRFTMLIVKHDTNWAISYHTSSHPQPNDQATAGKGAQQASVVPMVPAECR